jgi:hypothetical protein
LDRHERAVLIDTAYENNLECLVSLMRLGLDLGKPKSKEIGGLPGFSHDEFDPKSQVFYHNHPMSILEDENQIGRSFGRQIRIALKLVVSTTLLSQNSIKHFLCEAFWRGLIDIFQKRMANQHLNNHAGIEQLIS